MNRELREDPRLTDDFNSPLKHRTPYKEIEKEHMKYPYAGNPKEMLTDD